ncbi:MAG TPA: hypothetical protein VMV83_05100 [Rectinemataceae bacterium]|nr:hypothetical protein [Rectinemataceae bacterium]
MKSGTLRDGTRKLALLMVLVGFVSPLIAEDFEWQGSIGQGLKASILIPGATEAPSVIMHARTAERLAAAKAAGAEKPFAWIVDLRLVVQNAGKALLDRTPGQLRSNGDGLICIIDSSANPIRDIGDVYIGCESEKPAVWIKATDSAGLDSAGIVLKSPPLLKGPLLILEFLDWPKDDPMIGGT